MSWAAINLAHLPGRCPDCGWHPGTQGHACDRSGPCLDTRHTPRLRAGRWTCHEAVPA